MPSRLYTGRSARKKGVRETVIVFQRDDVSLSGVDRSDRIRASSNDSRPLLCFALNGSASPI